MTNQGKGWFFRCNLLGADFSCRCDVYQNGSGEFDGFEFPDREGFVGAGAGIHAEEDGRFSSAALVFPALKNRAGLFFACFPVHFHFFSVVGEGHCGDILEMHLNSIVLRFSGEETGCAHGSGASHEVVHP